MTKQELNQAISAQIKLLNFRRQNPSLDLSQLQEVLEGIERLVQLLKDNN